MVMTSHLGSCSQKDSWRMRRQDGPKRSGAHQFDCVQILGHDGPDGTILRLVNCRRRIFDF